MLCNPANQAFDSFRMDRTVELPGDQIPAVFRERVDPVGRKLQNLYYFLR